MGILPSANMWSARPIDLTASIMAPACCWGRYELARHRLSAACAAVPSHGLFHARRGRGARCCSRFSAYWWGLPAPRPVDGLIAQWRERGDEPEVTLASETTLLDRHTRIVEVRDPSGSVARPFVDPERMFIMRWAVEAGGCGQSYRAEVTALDFGAEIDAARFTFEPPRGAREAEAEDTRACSGASGPMDGAPPAPRGAGFLQPAYAPPGYQTVGTGSESGAGGCGPVAVWALLEVADGRVILLRQRLRPGGMPLLDSSWQ